MVKHKSKEFSEKNYRIGAISHTVFCIVAFSLSSLFTLLFLAGMGVHGFPPGLMNFCVVACCAAAILQCNSTPAELV